MIRHRTQMLHTDPSRAAVCSHTRTTYCTGYPEADASYTRTTPWRVTRVQLFVILFVILSRHQVRGTAVVCYHTPERSPWNTPLTACQATRSCDAVPAYTTHLTRTNVMLTAAWVKLGMDTSP